MVRHQGELVGPASSHHSGLNPAFRADRRFDDAPASDLGPFRVRQRLYITFARNPEREPHRFIDFPLGGVGHGGDLEPAHSPGKRRRGPGRKGQDFHCYGVAFQPAVHRRSFSGHRQCGWVNGHGTHDAGKQHGSEFDHLVFDGIQDLAVFVLLSLLTVPETGKSRRLVPQAPEGESRSRLLVYLECVSDLLSQVGALIVDRPGYKQ